MKKVLLAMVAGMMMTANVMAQEANQNGQERRQMDPKEMVKQRTEQTVKQYGLNEEQASKLLDLNTRFMGKIPMGPMGGQRMGQGRRPQMGQMGQMPQRPQRPQNDSVQGRRAQRGQMGGNFEEMRKNMETYEAELKTILTEEQFKAYSKDQQSRFQGRRGERPHRDINNNN